MESIRDENPHQAQMSKLVIIKNVTVLCLGVVLLFTAYDGLAMLQSTMNLDQGIGVISQAIIYGGFCISSLLFPKYVITKLGSKMTLALSMLTYVPYIASNFYPHWVLMIPSSICIGFGASLLWGSQANYLNDIAVMYASLSSGKRETVSFIETGKRNYTTFPRTGDESQKKIQLTNPGQLENHGLSEMNDNAQTVASNYDNSKQGGLYPCNVSIGLHQEKNPTTSTTNAQTITSNSGKSKHEESSPYDVKAGLYIEKDPITSAGRNNNIRVKTVPKIIESTTALFFGFHGMAYLSSHIWSNLMTYFVLRSGASETFSNVTCVCGADFCNVESECFVSNVDPPSDSTRFLLSGVCTSLGLLSILVVALFLDPLETKRKEVRFSLDLMFATCKIMRRKELMLLIPMSFFLGQAKGFYTGDITKSYIGCAWGAYHVGLVTVFYGVACGLSSCLSGWLVKRLGRLAVLSAATALDLAACIFLLLWSPDRRDTAMFFLAAVMWGGHVGTSWAQLRALYGMLFKADEEAAFAAFHAWYSLGFCLSFGYSNYVCTEVKIYVLLIVSTVGYIGYILVERIQRKKLKS